jgi:hypothetical protein
VYFIKRSEGSSICKFAFSCHAAKDILINGGEDMLQELYSGIHHFIDFNIFVEYRLPSTEFLEGYDITLGIDTNTLPKT